MILKNDLGLMLDKLFLLSQSAQVELFDLAPRAIIELGQLLHHESWQLALFERHPLW